MDSLSKRRSREQVLLVQYADGYAEAYADKHIEVKIIRCPATFSVESEIVAEDYIELSLPWSWRRLFFPGFRRATAMLKPLLPSKLMEAKGVRELIHLLNQQQKQERAA